ncbi:MAG: DNA-directed RNA polymerase subunit alpha [candidate division WOR-3 bacterium]
MRLKPFLMPEKVVIDEKVSNERHGRFIISPLERGWGVTLGNTLRRALLSSIQGSAITQVRIDAERTKGKERILHEFTTIPGVVEDVVQIILNIKKVRVKLLTDEPRTLMLKIRGKKEYFGRDIEKNPEVVVVSLDQKICTVTDNNLKLTIEMIVDLGRGYVPAEMLKQEDAPIGTIFVDGLFSPVTNVSFNVSNTRVGQRTDYDSLTIDVDCDGTITPTEAMIQASKLLKEHINLIMALGEEPELATYERIDAETKRLRDLLSRSVEELEISVRASNCLKKDGIKTIGELVRRTEADMLKIENFGRKSLSELKKVLAQIGLSFGMDVDAILNPKEGKRL